ncbi:MAG: type II secretion system secretin GspD [Desulfobacterales bacterium]|nr:type II secretion system secretin GspD [Desulfobacterales bacterium]
MTLVYALIFLAPCFPGSMVGPSTAAAQTPAPPDDAEQDQGRSTTPFSNLKKGGQGDPNKKSDTLKSFLEKFSGSRTGASQPAPVPVRKKAGKKPGPKPAPKPGPRPAPPEESEAEPEPGAGDAPGIVSGADGFSLEFNNEDLYLVINLFAELLNIDYIVDPNVRGRVTMKTVGKLGRKDLLPVFVQILEMNGLTFVKEGGLYKITPVKEAPRLTIPYQREEDRESLLTEQNNIIRVIPLRFISAQEMTKLLSPFISAGGTIIYNDHANTLIVVDRGVNVYKMLKIVDTFDVDLFDKVGHRFYPLDNMEVEEMVRILAEIFTPAMGERKDYVKFIPIENLKGFIAVSPDPLVFLKVDEFVRQLDVVSEESEPRIYVYYVKNGSAEDLASLLNDVFPEPGERRKVEEKVKEKTKTVRNPLSREAVKKKEASPKATKAKKKTPKAAAAVSEGAGTLKAEINIVADAIRNALIIEAIPSDYRTIRGILEQIDILPRQVLIEATVAEIRLKDETKIGLDLFYDGSQATQPDKGLYKLNMNKTVTGNPYTTALEYVTGDHITATLYAMANNDTVNILSSPHILASDNQEARIDVSNEVPVASSTTTTTADNPVTTATIQYRDTGVILTVTPHINERGLVTLDIDQEVSQKKEEDIEVAGSSYPSFFKRNIATTLTVKHGQTIVIGGLISENKTNDNKGVPWLSKVPILGYLFKTEADSVEKREMIILITPWVITDLEDIDSVTREFQNKVGGAMELVK